MLCDILRSYAFLDLKILESFFVDTLFKLLSKKWSFHNLLSRVKYCLFT